MEHNNHIKNILKESTLFRLYFILMSILAVAYVSIETYKSEINKPLIEKSGLTKSEFLEAHSLTILANNVEIALVVLALLGVWVIYLKKYRPYMGSFLISHIIFLAAIFLMGTVVAKIFDAPVGNLTEIVFSTAGPVLLLLIIYIALSVKKGLSVLTSS
ncbi:hypothetical protein [Halalkalibacillus sediminis]|uniref:hypothetical protein n=1 Tax=Halalkalibacillus sediminis TaxID=2018042 RepID=UPI001179C87B|nr:hypothetical protein [Halalkalibacillus sediminis]